MDLPAYIVIDDDATGRNRESSAQEGTCALGNLRLIPLPLHESRISAFSRFVKKGDALFVARRDVCITCEHPGALAKDPPTDISGFDIYRWKANTLNDEVVFRVRIADEIGHSFRLHI